MTIKLETTPATGSETLANLGNMVATGMWSESEKTVDKRILLQFKGKNSLLFNASFDLPVVVSKFNTQALCKYYSRERKLYRLDC